MSITEEELNERYANQSLKQLNGALSDLIAFKETAIRESLDKVLDVIDDDITAMRSRIENYRR